MTWPTQQTKANFDAGTDDPKQARGEFAANVDLFNQLRNHVTSFMRTFLSRIDAAGARADLAAFHDNVSATSRFLGRITAGAGNVEELTGTQATTLLNAFTSSLKGLVPASGGGTVNFLRADGAFADPTAGFSSGAVAFIESQDLSAAATADFTGFDATKYDGYVFELMNLVPVTDDAKLWIRTSTDGGATYDSGVSDYVWGLRTQVVAAQELFGDESDAKILLTSTDVNDAVGSAAGEDGWSGTVRVHGPHLAKETRVTFQGLYTSATPAQISVHGSGARLSATDVDALQFLFSVGSIESGTITMYGLRNAA